MSFQSLSKHASAHVRRAFTLAEILVAVGILIAILLVAGRVFQTAQQVSNMGNAAADVLQETAAIEKQIRADIERMSPQGMIAIHSVRVQNDQRIIDWQLSGGQGPRPGLINPNLDASAKIRCDQLVFLTDGISRLKQYGSDGYLTTQNDGAAGADWFPKLLGEGAMVYYGHAVQFPDELKAANMNQPLEMDPPFRHGHDIDVNSLTEPVTPWFYGGVDAEVPTVYRRYARSVTDEDSQSFPNFDYSYDSQAAEPIRGTQPEARKWILARQEVLFGDDDNKWPGADNKRIYMQRAFGVKSIFPTDPRFSTNDDSIGFESEPLIQCGRVDLAASRIGGIRQALGVSRDPGDPSSIMSHRPFDETDASVDYWGVRNTAVLDEDVLGEEAYQRDLIKSVVNWPRAERTPPGETRFDKHLTNHALGSACSSFIVEWTWDEGVGETDTVRIDPQTGRETDRTFRGLVIDPVDTWNGAEGSPILGQRWFGMYDSGRKVMPFGDVDSNNSQVEDALGWQNFCETFPLDGEPGSAPPSVLYSDPQGPRVNSNFNYIEDASYAASMGIDPSESVQEYWAIFGLNRKDALLSPDQSDMSDGYQDLDPSYTPWPTALRFTMTLHDPDTKLENGQQVQFIVKLPERCQ